MLGLMIINREREYNAGEAAVLIKAEAFICTDENKAIPWFTLFPDGTVHWHTSEIGAEVYIQKMLDNAEITMSDLQNNSILEI